MGDIDERIHPVGARSALMNPPGFAIKVGKCNHGLGSFLVIRGDATVLIDWRRH